MLAAVEWASGSFVNRLTNADEITRNRLQMFLAFAKWKIFPGMTTLCANNFPNCVHDNNTNSDEEWLGCREKSNDQNHFLVSKTLHSLRSTNKNSSRHREKNESTNRKEFSTPDTKYLINFFFHLHFAKASGKTIKSHHTTTRAILFLINFLCFGAFGSFLPTIPCLSFH